MCAIFGVIVHRFSNAAYITNTLWVLAKRGEERGGDGLGIAVIRPGEKPVLFSFRSVLEADGVIVYNEIQRGPCMVIGVNRFAPLAEPPQSEKARQPIEASRVLLAHNGTFSNDRLVRARHDFPSETGIDSEVLAHLYRLRRQELPDTEHPRSAGMAALPKALAELEGGLAVALVDLDEPQGLLLARNYNPLSCTVEENENFSLFWFHSLPEPLANRGRPYPLPPYSGLYVTLGGNFPGSFDIGRRHAAEMLPPASSAEEEGALVICSGGMDSSLAAFVAAKAHGSRRVKLFFVDYLQKAVFREEEAVQDVAKALRYADYPCEVEVVTVGQLKRWHPTSPIIQGGAEVPRGMASAESCLSWVAARNLVILALATACAEAEGYRYLYTGFNLEEAGAYPDNSFGFYKAFSDLLPYATVRRVEIRQGITHLMKHEIVQLGDHLGVPLDRTWSCETAGERRKAEPIPCGICGPCWNRRLAFLRAGVPDPRTYARPIEDAGPLPAWFPSYPAPPAPVATILAKVKRELAP